MKKRGLKNELKVQKILRSGSLSIPEKNLAGVRLVKKSKPIDNNKLETQIDDSSEGIISGKLIRPSYNINELKKSIDTEISELLPIQVDDGPPMVPKSQYDSASVQIGNLVEEIGNLENNINQLNSEIQSLYGVTESLKIETDGALLRADIADTQTKNANEQISKTTIDLSNAIQNSINESIQRVSLTARNESLEQEVENLREQLFGLAAQTSEGAQSGGNNKFTVKVKGGEDKDEDFDIFAKTSQKEGYSRTMGVTLEVNNVTGDNKITNIDFNIIGEPKWFTVKDGANTIEPQLGESYDLEFDNDVIGKGKGGIRPKKKGGLFGGWRGSARSYRDTSLDIKVTFQDETTDSLKLKTRLYKRKG